MPQLLIDVKLCIRIFLVFPAILHTGTSISIPWEELQAILNERSLDTESQSNSNTATTIKSLDYYSSSNSSDPEYYENQDDYYLEPDLSAIRLMELKDFLERIELQRNASNSNMRISEKKCLEYIWDVNKKVKAPRAVILGGHDAKPLEFPQMAAIGWATGKRHVWIFKCGGTLISYKFVLTAAHCSRTTKDDSTVSNPVPKIVRLGVIRIDIAEKLENYDYDIKKIIVHPDYKSPKKYHDIALIELNKRFPVFEQVAHPACLWPEHDTSKIGEKVTVTGWGVVRQEPQPVASPMLQVGDVEIIDFETCNELLLPWCSRIQCGVRDHQICAGVLAGGVDACQGDSGGPLQVKVPLEFKFGKMYYVIGVTSYEIGCAEAKLPGVYTRVSSYIDWIEAIVWPN